MPWSTSTHHSASVLMTAKDHSHVDEKYTAALNCVTFESIDMKHRQTPKIMLHNVFCASRPWSLWVICDSSVFKKDTKKKALMSVCSALYKPVQTSVMFWCWGACQRRKLWSDFQIPSFSQWLQHGDNPKHTVSAEKHTVGHCCGLATLDLELQVRWKCLDQIFKAR